MKKFVILIMALMLTLAPCVLVNAEESAYTVDGNAERWEQETANALSLADMVWDANADTLHFKGTGYKDRLGMKFGFRCKIAFSTSEWGINIKFPEEFADTRTEENNMHFVLAFVNTYSQWWNTDGNSVKSAAFIIRPQTQDEITVEFAGRWGIGLSGYGDISTTNVVNITLDQTRTVEFSMKMETEGVAVYLNGTKQAMIDKELSEGKTMSDYISEFHDGKGYLHFGATLENDTQDKPLEYTITKMVGALDAFQEVVPIGPTESAPPIEQEPTNTTASADINIWYVILYGVAGVIGVGAVVCYVLSAIKK